MSKPFHHYMRGVSYYHIKTSIMRGVSYYHIKTSMPATWITACGLPTKWREGGLSWTARPTDRVTCPECRNSEAFKDDLIQFEIGFEGDSEAWDKRNV